MITAYSDMPFEFFIMDHQHPNITFETFRLRLKAAKIFCEIMLRFCAY
jgi:hypothetical protein